jgi:hypothetical protein
MFEYAARLIDVIDADTLRLEIDLGFSVFVKQSCRLARLNAPEITTIDGALTKVYVIAQLQKAINLKVFTSKAEKYGRWLVEVNMQLDEPTAQWVNLNDLLLTTRHAAPYPP